MRTLPAWPGEFGLKVLRWAPQVYALCQQEPCIVEVERGNEALYPAAHRWRVVDRADDDTRHGNPPDLGVESERFVPEPVSNGFDYRPDVVVCPRWREYGAEKNWGQWPRLVRRLRGRGISVVAAGAPDSSVDVPCDKAWEHKRFLDASIAMMRSTKLVIATDAGLAHLAVLCGADLLVVTHRGLVAPGPVVDSSGRVAADSYQRAGWDRHEKENRFEAANHTGARIEYVDGWEDVSAVMEAVETWTEASAAA